MDKVVRFIKDNSLSDIMAKINVEIPDSVAIALRKLVIDKYGSMRGMGKEVEAALRDHLSKNGVIIESDNAKNEKSQSLNPLMAAETLVPVLA